MIKQIYIKIIHEHYLFLDKRKMGVTTNVAFPIFLITFYLAVPYLFETFSSSFPNLIYRTFLAPYSFFNFINGVTNTILITRMSDIFSMFFHFF